MTTATAGASPRRRIPRLPPRPVLTLLEWPRALAEAATLPMAYPFLARAPRGDPHPVLVLPGFTAGDESTRALREFIRSLGYTAHRWTLGRNMGLDDGVGGRMLERVRALHERYDTRISIVGQSLGGVYARELAKLAPESVRQVISLGSPFGSRLGGQRFGWLFRAVTGEDLSREALDRFDTLEPAPPVPSTAIYSRTDGVTGWEACMEKEGHQIENIEVPGSHCGMGFNALVYLAIADRLAVPEGGWRPFDRSGLRALLYR